MPTQTNAPPDETLEHLRRHSERMAALEEKISALEHERASLRESATHLEWQLKQYQEIKDKWDWFFTNSLDLLLVHDEDGALRRVSPSVQRVLGYTPDEFMRCTIADVMHPDDLARTIEHIKEIASGVDGVNFESRILHKDGRWRWMAWTTPAPPPDRRGAKPTFAMARDITESKLTQQELLHRAQHDAMTGLANRALFEQAVRSALARSERAPENRVAVMLLDLDGFKAVNDQHGHLAGDEVLKTVALRLAEACRRGDVVARLGGDEFACLLEGASGAALDSVAARILELVCQPITFGGVLLQVGCSIGIATHPATASNFAELVQQADTAMYAVKANGKRGIRHFAPHE